MVARQEASITDHVAGHPRPRGRLHRFPTESPLGPAYWESAFGPGWQQKVQKIFNSAFDWNDVLHFFEEPNRHSYGTSKERRLSEMYYFAEQLGGPRGENKIHVAVSLPGAKSTRHMHEHDQGWESYFLVFGDMILLKGDDDNLETVRLLQGGFKTVDPNTWHQARTLDEPSLVIVTNYKASNVSSENLHRLHPNQLHDWMLLEEKPL